MKLAKLSFLSGTLASLRTYCCMSVRAVGVQRQQNFQPLFRFCRFHPGPASGRDDVQTSHAVRVQFQSAVRGFKSFIPSGQHQFDAGQVRVVCGILRIESNGLLDGLQRPHGADAHGLADDCPSPGAGNPMLPVEKAGQHPRQRNAVIFRMVGSSFDGFFLKYSL